MGARAAPERDRARPRGLGVQPTGARERGLPANRGPADPGRLGAVRPSPGPGARGGVRARDEPPLRGPPRPEQARGGSHQGVLLLPAARPGQPADRLGGGRHRDLPRRLPEALRRAGSPRPRGVRRRRVAGGALHLLPSRVGLPLSVRARGLLRAAPRGHALRRARGRVRRRRRTGHDGRRRAPGPGEGLPGDRRAGPPGRPRPGGSRRRRRRAARRFRAFDSETIGATLREHLETLAGAEAVR